MMRLIPAHRRLLVTAVVATTLVAILPSPTIADDRRRILQDVTIGGNNTEGSTSDAIALPSDLPTDADVNTRMTEAKNNMTVAALMKYYDNEPTFSLFITQLPESANMTADSIVEGDECMLSEGSNLYQGSKQSVISGGCFGDLDSRVKNVILTGTADDMQPESFKISAVNDSAVTLERFLGSRQCEACLQDRCVAEEYTFPINRCFYWQPPPKEGAGFFVVVSRADTISDLQLRVYTDKDCAKQFKTPMEDGPGAPQCLGRQDDDKERTPGAYYDEAFQFQKKLSTDKKPIESYTASRWERGNDCQEGFRTAFLGTAKKESMEVPINKCVKWTTEDGDRTFYIKATRTARSA